MRQRAVNLNFPVTAKQPNWSSNFRIDLTEIHHLTQLPVCQCADDFGEDVLLLLDSAQEGGGSGQILNPTVRIGGPEN